MKPVDVRLKTLALGVAAIVAGPALGQSPSHQQFVCMRGAEKRVISVINDDAPDAKRSASSCRVDYTKSGETRTVWSSKTGHAYCVAKATSLVTNLVEGNFTCKPETIESPGQGEAPSQSH